MKIQYIKRDRGGYWVSAGEDADNLPMIKVEPITGTRRVGETSCWVATHKKLKVIRDTRKEAVAALYAELADGKASQERDKCAPAT